MERQTPTQVAPFEIDPNTCVSDQLAQAGWPKEVSVKGGLITPCVPEWIQDLHCIGVIDGYKTQGPWEVWDTYFRYQDNKRIGYGDLDMDVEVAIVGPDDECFIWRDTLLSPPEPPHLDPYYSNDPGNCAIEIMETCACQADSTPKEATCYDLTIP